MSDLKFQLCSGCPSFLPPGKVQSKFGKETGTAMCGRFGIVLGRPGLNTLQSEKLLRHFASKCDSYGKPLPPEPIEKRLTVALPAPDARNFAENDSLATACSSCSACSKYIRADGVMKEFGWTEGLCAARGKLIFGNKMIYEARGCEYREFGVSKYSTFDVILLPEYATSFQATSDPIREYFKNKSNIVQPSDYPTDREVTPEETAGGVRAWRKITDPEGSGNQVFLPIYETSFFSEEEQNKIPKTGSDEHPEYFIDHFGGVYLAAVAWTELDETPALWSPAGLGKTEFFRHVAWLMNLPFERISITATTEIDELAGKMLYSPSEGTHFQLGRIPLAWSKPCVICLDEVNVGPPEVWQFLRPMVDNSKQLILDMNKGERISRHNDCYLGLAMNPAWSVVNVGAQQISDADSNRLLHVQVELPPALLEREIIKNKVSLDGWEINENQLSLLMDVASELRDLIEDGSLPISWGIRPQLKVARALRWFDVITAYNRAIGDFLEPESREILLRTVRGHLEKF